MPDDKGPNIAEKVRFWEEQDKINQALIPRVVETHEAVRNLHQRTASISGQIAAAEARVLKQAKSQVQQEVTRLAQDISVTAQTVREVQAQVKGLSIPATQQPNEMPAAPPTSGDVRLVAYAALILAAVACVLSIYQLFS